VVNEQADGHQRMASPHAGQKLLRYVSHDTGGIPDDCSNTHHSLLPYPKILFYRMKTTCTQGTYLKRFFPLSPPSPKITGRDFYLLLIGLIKVAFSPFSSLELSLP